MRGKAGDGTGNREESGEERDGEEGVVRRLRVAEVEEKDDAVRDCVGGAAMCGQLSLATTVCRRAAMRRDRAQCV